MWHRLRPVKYSYLLQSIVTLSLALLIPATLFAFTVVRRAYEEMVRRNEEHYINVTESFSSYFDDRLVLMRNQATRIGINNRENDPRLSWSRIAENSYNIKMAADALKEYLSEFTYFNDIGLYYPDGDMVITSSYAYNTDSFVSRYAAQSDEMAARLRQMLGQQAAHSFSMTSSFDLLGHREGQLFISVPVTMSGGHRAVIFYIIEHDSLNTSFFDTPNTASASISILDGNGQLLFTNRAPDYGLLISDAFAGFLADTGTQRLYLGADETPYTVLKVQNRPMGYAVVSMIPRDEIESSYYYFYQIMLRTTLLISAALTLLLGLTIYVNYRPILKLLEGFQSARTQGEIQTIEQTLSRMRSQVEAQNTRLMDYLLGNLLYGIPIPPDEALRFDEARRICVLVAADWKADESLRATLSRQLEEECGGRVYILDIRDKPHTAFVGILPHADAAAFSRSAQRLLLAALGRAYRIGAGMPVDTPDELRRSYLNALFMLEASYSTAPRTGSPAPDVDDYPTEEILRFLFCLRSGDRGNTLDILEHLHAYARRCAHDPVTSRYLWYDLLISAIKVMQEMKHPTAEREAQRLLCCNSAEEFFDALRDAAAVVCDAFPARDNTLKDDVLAWVDDHFTMQSFSQTDVAARFDISVHTLRRLFREQLGQNFSDYVISKRLDYAKQLLLTTDMSVSEIAGAVGLTDPNYFSRLFKAKVGITPLLFRNRSMTARTSY